MKFTRQHILFISLLLLFLVARFHRPQRSQVWEDHDIALNLLHDGEFYYESDGVKNHTFQFPVYAHVLAILYYVTDEMYEIAIAFNIFIHVLSTFLLYHIFKKLSNLFFNSWTDSQIHLVSSISAVLFLIHPALLVYALYHIHPISLNIFTIFLALYFSIRFALNPSRRNSLAYGLILGLCMLDRATSVFTFIPSILWIIYNKKFKEKFKELIVVGLISFLVILPWLMHNYSTDGIIGFESSAAKNKWKGVLYNSDGSNYLNNGENYYAALTEQEKWNLGEMSPIEQRDFFQMKYNTIAYNDPGHVIKMFFIKLKNFWWFRDSVGTEWGEMKNYLLFYKIFYAIILIGVSLFLIVSGTLGWIWMSFPLSLSFLQAYFYVETRHRIAIEPLLIFFAVIAFYHFYKSNKKRNHEFTHI